MDIIESPLRSTYIYIGRYYVLFFFSSHLHSSVRKRFNLKQTIQWTLYYKPIGGQNNLHLRIYCIIGNCNCLMHLQSRWKIIAFSVHRFFMFIIKYFNEESSNMYISNLCRWVNIWHWSIVNLVFRLLRCDQMKCMKYIL